MLFYAAGSSCAGKTTTLPALGGLPSLVVHDFDEVGVPSNADTAWRQEAMEGWVQYAVQRQEAGLDVFLAGQSPLGEVLAAPSTPTLEAVATCLLDVDDEVRLHRLRMRDGDRWDAQALDAFVGWGRWHREHAADPQVRPEVIRAGAWPQMQWDRWAGWRSGDARWSVPVFDTTSASPEEVGAAVVAWIVDRRRAAAAGTVPLAGDWTSQ